MRRAIVFVGLLVYVVGCATTTSVVHDLNDLKAKARIDLYKSCMRQLNQTAAFGTLFYVHLTCQEYSRRNVH
jgi:hypothetical protein